MSKRKLRAKHYHLGQRIKNQQHYHFGQWIKSQRLELLQRQSDAAKAAGVSRITWAAWESGKDVPKNMKHILAIAKWADKEPDVVFNIVRQFYNQ